MPAAGAALGSRARAPEDPRALSTAPDGTSRTPPSASCTAYLVADRWLHSIMIFRGSDLDRMNSLHDGWRGRKTRQEEKKENRRPRVTSHIGLRRRGADSILRAAHPALAPASSPPRVSTPPLGQALRQVQRAASPLVERGEKGWARGPREGDRQGRAPGRDMGCKEAGEAGVTEKKRKEKNPRVGGKWWNTQGHVMESADSVKLLGSRRPAERAVGARAAAAPAESVRSAARWRKAAAPRAQEEGRRPETPTRPRLDPGAGRGSQRGSWAARSAATQ